MDLLTSSSPAPEAGDHDRRVEQQRRPVPGSVSVIARDGQAHVVLRGEVDLDLGDELLAATTAVLEQNQPVSIDARDVTFMDSTGVAFLARVASRAPGPLCLVDPPDLVRFLVGVTSVSSMVNIVMTGGAISAGQTAPALRLAPDPAG